MRQIHFALNCRFLSPKVHKKDAEMAKTYAKHKKDPQSGARYYYGTLKDGDKTRYTATITRGGKRWRFMAGTKAEVEEKVAIQLLELAKEGVDAVRLTKVEKHDAAAARKLLGDGETLESALKELSLVRDVLGTGRELANALDAYSAAQKILGGRATLAEAAAFWSVRNPDGGGVTFGEACTDFLAYIERVRVHSHAKHVRAHLEALATWLGKGDVQIGNARPVVSIEAGDMDAFLDARKLDCEAGRIGDWKRRLEEGKPLLPVSFSDATRNKWIVTFRHFFGWATKKYDLPVNPAARLNKLALPTTADKIEFLHDNQVEKLLRAAERIAPAYVPAVAILFFAGLRPVELAGKYEAEGEALPGLDWTRVDRDGYIVVEGETTKTRQRRTVPIESNLKVWLDAYAPEIRTGQVAKNPTAWQKAKKAIVKEAGIAWPQDGARHTYATMYFAKYADRARLEANMGHTVGSGVLEANYKSLVSRGEAERFWSILPRKTTASTKKGGRK